MSTAIITRNLTGEEWNRISLLLFDRVRSRLWLMRESLNIIHTTHCGESLEVSATSLEGLSFIVEDMLNEISEATDILRC